MFNRGELPQKRIYSYYGKDIKDHLNLSKYLPPSTTQIISSLDIACKEAELCI